MYYCVATKYVGDKNDIPVQSNVLQIVHWIVLRIEKLCYPTTIERLSKNKTHAVMAIRI
jgi:hypothetical protein